LTCCRPFSFLCCWSDGRGFQQLGVGGGGGTAVLVGERTLGALDLEGGTLCACVSCVLPRFFLLSLDAGVGGLGGRWF